MNDQQMEDLKQFIDTRISQAEVGLGERIDDLDERVGSLAKALESLRLEVLDDFAGVGEAIDEINKHFDERLTKLEQPAV